MRFSTIVSALALATSVTAAAITPDLQSTSNSLSQRSIELNGLAGLLSDEGLSPAEVRSIAQVLQTALTLPLSIADP